MALTLKNKIARWVSDRKDDIDFLRSDNVSTLFKILNILSGDRLRSWLIFAYATVVDIKRAYDDLLEVKEEFNDISFEEYDSWVETLLEERIDRAVRELKEGFEI